MTAMAIEQPNIASRSTNDPCGIESSGPVRWTSLSLLPSNPGTSAGTPATLGWETGWPDSQTPSTSRRVHNNESLRFKPELHIMTFVYRDDLNEVNWHIFLPRQLPTVSITAEALSNFSGHSRTAALYVSPGPRPKL